MNIPLALTKVHYLLQSYLKDLFKKKCKPATDILVFLISESTHSRKPYAIPVQCIPHAGLQDQEVQAITDRIMTKIRIGKKLFITIRGMKQASRLFIKNLDPG